MTEGGAVGYAMGIAHGGIVHNGQKRWDEGNFDTV
jgi:hypothetical protein